MKLNEYVKIINTSVKLSAVFLEIEEHLQKTNPETFIDVNFSTSTKNNDYITYNMFLNVNGNLEKFVELSYDPDSNKYYLYLIKENNFYELNFMSIIPDIIKEGKRWLF